MAWTPEDAARIARVVAWAEQRMRNPETQRRRFFATPDKKRRIELKTSLAQTALATATAWMLNSTGGRGMEFTVYNGPQTIFLGDAAGTTSSGSTALTVPGSKGMAEYWQDANRWEIYQLGCPTTSSTTTT